MNELWVLNIENLEWKKVNCDGEVPPPRYGHTAHLVGSRMFIFGGKGPNGVVYRDTYYLDIETWVWVLVSPSSTSPNARFFHASELVGKKIVVHGGWDGNEVFDDLWVFNTDLFSWMKPRTAGFGPTSRYGHTISLTSDGRLFVFGGCSLDNETRVPKYHSDVHVLDTETMIWARPRINGATPTGRYGHSATLLDNGHIVIFGGWGSGGCQTREWIKDPRAHSLHILDSHSMTWWVPSKTSNDVIKNFKHLYNHSACRANNTTSICLFGGFDGRQSIMDFSVIGIEYKPDE